MSNLEIPEEDLAKAPTESTLISAKRDPINTDPRPSSSQIRKVDPKKAFVGLVGILILIFLGWTFSNITPGGDLKGTATLSEKNLTDLVRTNHLTVYWSGPEPNFKYTLTVPRAGVAVVKYLPHGNGLSDPSPNYRVIATYLQKNAYQAMSKAVRTPANVFFTNIDGDLVFYLRASPSHVYVAPKVDGIQIEVFDPEQDQALALALLKGKVRKIQ